MWEKAFHALIGHTDAIGFGRQQLVGHSGIGVLLLQQGGDALFLSLLEHGTAGITANADGDIGLEILEDITRQAHALEQPRQDRHIAQQVLAVKTAHGQADDIIARSGHFFHFHSSLGTHKQDSCFRVTAAHLVGNRQGREDVASRTAAAHQDVELLIVTSRHF